MLSARRYLGREYGLFSKFRVFLREDSLEVDELNYAEVERSRVYFDDILLMTYHRTYGTIFLVSMAVIASVFLLSALLTGLGAGSAADRRLAVVLLALSSPFVVAFILRIIFRVDVITVYGRRTFARIYFHWRKARAREVFDDLRKRIEARQAQVAKEQAALAPPAPPPEPPGPPAFPETPPLPPAFPLDPPAPPAV